MIITLQLSNFAELKGPFSNSVQGFSLTGQCKKTQNLGRVFSHNKLSQMCRLSQAFQKFRKNLCVYVHFTVFILKNPIPCCFHVYLSVISWPSSHVFFLCRAFDVELLYIAQRLKIALTEVAINWTEIDGLYTTYFTNSYMLVKVEDLSPMKFFLLEYSLLYTRETLLFSLPPVNFKHQRYQKQQG